MKQFLGIVTVFVLGIVDLQVAGVKMGQEILIEAWQPSTRIPPVSGLQRHEPIPEKGDGVKMYLLKNKKAKTYEPLLPNGIEITKKAKKTK